MATPISSGMPVTPTKVENTCTSVGTADSTQPSSAGPGTRDSPGRKDIKVEMAMSLVQNMENEEGHESKHYFPSAASLGSSVWSSDGGYSTHTSDSYAWSASLGSSESDYSSDYSDSEESSSEIDEEEENDAAPAEKSFPQPPSGMEGLPMGFSLESLKRDLEKVGRAIIGSGAGEAAAERAHALASINWLASHVPNAVLDQLGHETRAMIEDEKGGGSNSDDSQDTRMESVVESDNMSDVSDLSNVEDQLEFAQGGADPADASNVPERYGDLADLTQAKDVIVNILPQPDLPGIEDIPLIPEEKPSLERTMGILDILPQKADESPNMFVSPGPTEIRDNSEKPSTTKSKGTKGLFKRFSKRNKGDTGAPGLIGESPTAPANKISNSVSTDDSDVSQSLAGSTGSIAEDSMGTLLDEEGNAPDKLKRHLPSSTAYRCALLFVDISGFTKLSTLLDPESLSKVSLLFLFVIDYKAGNQHEFLWIRRSTRTFSSL
jgi:hypothetical protein